MAIDPMQGMAPDDPNSGYGMPKPGMDGGGMDPSQLLQPVDHDPFDDPESVKAVLTNISLLEQRMFSTELTIAQAVQALGQALAQMGQDMAMLRAEQERLRQTMAMPRRITRDADGRPQGVVIDQAQ